MTKRHERLRPIAAIVAAMLSTFRCGGTPPDTSSGTVAAAARSQSPAKRNACLLAWVVKGDVRLKFTMPGLGADAMRANFVPLAHKALSRL